MKISNEKILVLKKYMDRWKWKGNERDKEEDRKKERLEEREK